MGHTVSTGEKQGQGLLGTGTILRAAAGTSEKMAGYINNATSEASGSKGHIGVHFSSSHLGLGFPPFPVTQTGRARLTHPLWQFAHALMTLFLHTVGQTDTQVNLNSAFPFAENL